MSADPTTTESAVGVGVVDPTVLGALAARLGDRAGGFLATLLDTWELETAQRLEELDRAITDGKRAGVARVAHSMRGSSAAMGAVRLSLACGQVEVAARGDEPTDLAAARDLLAAEVALALAALADLHRGGDAPV
ncbi:MAG: Histidine kinase [Frankiales bacterium]|nr:Histidine kinase [Frankiales bacterium]